MIADGGLIILSLYNVDSKYRFKNIPVPDLILVSKSISNNNAYLSIHTSYLEGKKEVYIVKLPVAKAAERYSTWLHGNIQRSVTEREMYILFSDSRRTLWNLTGRVLTEIKMFRETIAFSCVLFSKQLTTLRINHNF